MYSWLITNLLGSFLLTFSMPHGLNVRAEMRETRLRIEVWYDDDTPAENAKITIVNDHGLVREGKTDDKGVWTTTTLDPGVYQIQADAGAGHRKEIEFTMTGSVFEKHSAGPTKDEVKYQQWSGVVIGLAVLLGLILLGKSFLRNKRS